MKFLIIVGQKYVLERMLIGLLLLEDLPGLAKNSNCKKFSGCNTS
jgi:hypothetical protein